MQFSDNFYGAKSALYIKKIIQLLNNYFKTGTVKWVRHFKMTWTECFHDRKNKRIRLRVRSRDQKRQNNMVQKAYRQGEASRELAVLDPPGLWTEIGLSSGLGIIKLKPVADEDLTILAELDDDSGDICILGLAPPWWSTFLEQMTKGLGVLGSTETLGVTGRLLGPSKLRCPRDEVLWRWVGRESSMEIENFGKTSLAAWKPCSFCRRLNKGEEWLLLSLPFPSESGFFFSMALLGMVMHWLELLKLTEIFVIM